MDKDSINVGEAIAAGKEVLMNVINELIEEFRPTMTLEDLQRVYMKTVDEVILREENESNSKYVGGEFNLNCVSEKGYTIGYRLFFRNEQKKISELEAKSRELDISKLSQKVREQLRADKNIKFEIPEPSASARDKYNRESFKRR